MFKNTLICIAALVSLPAFAQDQRAVTDAFVMREQTVEIYTLRLELQKLSAENTKLKADLDACEKDAEKCPKPKK